MSRTITRIPERGTLRGFHYQLPHPQAKLITVVRGEIFDVAVDIRKGSPTFGKWCGIHLSERNKRQLFIPEGFAHGFLVLSQDTDVIYKCSELYFQEDEHGVIWSDPQIGVVWPAQDPIFRPIKIRISHDFLKFRRICCPFISKGMKWSGSGLPKYPGDRRVRFYRHQFHPLSAGRVGFYRTNHQC